LFIFRAWFSLADGWFVRFRSVCSVCSVVQIASLLACRVFIILFLSRAHAYAHARTWTYARTRLCARFSSAVSSRTLRARMNGNTGHKYARARTPRTHAHARGTHASVRGFSHIQHSSARALRTYADVMHQTPCARTASHARRAARTHALAHAHAGPRTLSCVGFQYHCFITRTHHACRRPLMPGPPLRAYAHARTTHCRARTRTGTRHISGFIIDLISRTHAHRTYLNVMLGHVRRDARRTYLCVRFSSS
jgi:hypothetical protein